MTTLTQKKYNKWKLKKEAFKKLKETKQYESYVYHKILHLPNNNIEEIPDWISELKELELLNLPNNNIKEMPSWIGELKELKLLHLPNNNIEEIPDWISELKELELLDLENNNIEEIPTETLKKCSSLKEMWLSNNSIPKKELKRAKEELGVIINKKTI